MEDGFQAIAKIPYHIALPRHYATASEVATLRFLHFKGIPVPKVYGHSSTTENPAGVEYMIMEKVKGVGVETKWQTMTKRERHTLATSFVDIEKKLFDIPFGATGSIYFKSDVPENLQASLCDNTDRGEGAQTEYDEFCIGPIADYMFWYGKRAGLDLYRGPCEYPSISSLPVLTDTLLASRDRCERISAGHRKEGIGDDTTTWEASPA